MISVVGALTLDALNARFVGACPGRYKSSVSLGETMQSFWFRIDSLLQKRPAASAGAETAKGDYLAGDKNGRPNWPRSGKARPHPPSDPTLPDRIRKSTVADPQIRIHRCTSTKEPRARESWLRIVFRSDRMWSDRRMLRCCGAGTAAALHARRDRSAGAGRHNHGLPVGQPAAHHVLGASLAISGLFMGSR